MKSYASVLTCAVIGASALLLGVTLPIAFAAPGVPAGPGGAGGGPARGPGGGRAGAPSAAATTVPLQLTKMVPDGKPHKFEAKNKQFTIDGDPTILIAGEMHFGRILPEDFEARVKQAKAMGINVLSFYNFWNLAEPEEGKFNFTGVNDLRRMFKICQDNGIWVVVRPGPYCCAEVDYGGIPYWAAKGENANVKIRSNDPKYLGWVKRYIDRLGQEIGDMQVTKGGPILMVQMENEFGMVSGAQGAGGYAAMTALTPIFRGAGFEVPLFVCDPGGGLRGGPNPYGEDILRGPNGMGANVGTWQASVAASDFPVYSPEVYTAWFSAWGQPIATRNSQIQSIVNTTEFFLTHNTSWCYYVFYGGTNWGFNTGTNEFLPLQTTYDYSAPIDEAGRVTPKFKALREAIAKHTGRTYPEPPADPAVVELPPIKLTLASSVVDSLPAKPTLTAAKTVSMEDLGQDYGFVLYRKQFPNGIKGTLELQQLMDYAITMVNGKAVGESFVGLAAGNNRITLNESGPTTLDILVHNLGRISVITSANSQWRARKGLIGGALLDGKELTDGGDWQMYSLPMNPPALTTGKTTAHTGPGFYTSTFNIDKPASTFLNLSNFGMGVVWVNGHNLGRFWDRGGARSLFLSEHFLKPGANQITVLELHGAPKMAEIPSTTKMVETPAVAFPVRLDNNALQVPGGPAPVARGGRGGGPGGPGAGRGAAPGASQPAGATQPGAGN